MKLKHKALTLLLSLAMLLSFTPTMAFATDDEEWSVTNSYNQVYVAAGGSVDLEVEVDNPVSADLAYTWYNGDFSEIQSLAETDSSKIIPNETGTTLNFKDNDGKPDEEITCVVSNTEDSDDYDTALFLVKNHWFVTNDDAEFYLGGGEVKISVVTNYKEIYGSAPSNPSYQWYEYEWVGDETEGDWEDVLIPGATGPSYIAKKEGTFSCRVTIGAIIEEGSYYVYEGDPDEDEEEDPDDPDDEYFDYQSVYINSLCYELNSKDEADQAGVWYYDENNKPSGSLTILDKVTLKNGKTYTVTELQSLYDLPGVTSITIPATVTLIEEQSIGFYGGYKDADEEEKGR